MQLEHLQSLAHDLQVDWHIRSELAVKGGALAPIGYVVELTATHGQHVHAHPTPGCPECQPIARALMEIATAVVPQEQGGLRYDVHVDPARHDFEAGEPLMMATITILSADGGMRGEPEQRGLDQILSALRRLGARERRSS